MFSIVPLKQGTFLYSCQCHSRMAKDPTRITGQMRPRVIEPRIVQLHQHYVDFKIHSLQNFAKLKQGKKRISD